MRYRADIDGLRTVAVVPIVLFHAGVEFIAGGFVGVDIFFVISGFLITSIILRDIEAGRFSLLEFYRRRILRIFPALFIMLAAVLIVGAATLLPAEVRSLGQSAASATAFVSNIFFYNDADYFAGAAEFKPLLHTWSLGVEEQFYIFFPLLLLLIVKLRRVPVGPAIAAVCVISLIVGAAQSRWSPAAAFYLLPARAWELGIGALVAVGAAPRLGEHWRAAAAWLGAALIVVGYVVIRPGAMFPVPFALLPVIGAALLIAYGESTLIGRVLATSPMTAIGRISYSLYLWHWPVIVFYRLNVDPHLTPSATALLVAVSFALAAASRHFVEMPFLRGLKAMPSRTVVAGGVASLAVVVIAALGVSWNADNWRALPEDVRHIASFADYRSRPEYQTQFRVGPCFAGESNAYDFEGCLKTVPGKRNIVVLGDSHAAQYWLAIAERFPDANVMQATASGCRAVLPLQGQKRCTEVAERVLGPFVQSGAADTLILAGRWTASDVAKMGPTIDAVKPYVREVYVIGPTVEYEGEFPQLLARAMLRGNPDGVSDFRSQRQISIDDQLSKVVAAHGGRYISAIDIECPEAKCRLTADGAPMQFDYGHLSLEGARFVVGHMTF
jgi:peptidoglycan/LPS O-acetylase OafA/YrhL